MSHEANFFDTHSPAPIIKQRKYRRWFWPIILVVLIILAAWVIYILIAAGKVVSASLDGRDSLLEARDAAVALDFEKSKEELKKAEIYFIQADNDFRLLKPIRSLPWVEDQIDAAEAMVISGRSVAAALIEVVDIGAELVRLTGLSDKEVAGIMQGISPDLTFRDLAPETRRAILLRLEASADDLELTQARIAIARSELQSIETSSVISPVVDALEPLDEQLVQLEEVVDTLSLAARIIPPFAGLEGEQAHLLLFLNNAEMRPGGGFVGSYGVLKTLDGDINSLQTHDVYYLDNAADPHFDLAPPLPLAHYLSASKWYFRDANWSPDFAVSSRQLIERFNAETQALPPEIQTVVQSPVAFSGVIGITPDFAADILKIIGPVRAGGQEFNAENIFDRLEYQVEYGYVGQDIPEEQRKEILADLVEKITDQLFSLPFSEWLTVIDVSKNALRTKQFILFSDDQKTEEMISKVNWGGRVLPSATDIQMVIDANLASLKTDPAVDRIITYEIFRNNDGRYVGRTKIKYQHTGRFDWKTTRYRTYTRLYVPAGSEFIRATGTLADDKTRNPSLASGKVDVGEELGLTYFGAFTAVEPGKTQEISFEYLLADQVVQDIQSGSYKLEVLKQIGAAVHSLTLNLDFDKNVTDASVPENKDQWGDDTYRLDTELDEDLKFEIEL